MVRKTRVRQEKLKLSQGFNKNDIFISRESPSLISTVTSGHRSPSTSMDLTPFGLKLTIFFIMKEMELRALSPTFHSGTSL